MNGITTLSGYWQLARWLIMPERYQYWIFIAALVASIVIALGAVSGLLKMEGGGIFVLIFSGAIVGLWFTFSIMMLHSQLLSLPANRQMALLSRVRIHALIIYLIMVTLPAALFQIFLWQFKEPGESLMDRFILIWSISVLFSLSFLLSILFFKCFSLMVLYCLWSLIGHFFWPLPLPSWLVLSIAISAIISFSYWWLNWNPAKRITNIFLMRSSQYLQFELSKSWLDLFSRLGLVTQIKEPRSSDLFRHLLYGPNGILAYRIVVMAIVSCFLLAVIWLFSVYGHDGAFDGIMPLLVPLSLWVYLSAILGLLARLYSCLGRVWLYFSGSRRAFFIQVERYLILTMLADLPFVGLVVGFACYWVYPEYLQFQWFGLYAGLVLSMNWMLYQVIWWIYWRTQGSRNWFFVGLSVMIFLQVFVAGLGYRFVKNEILTAQSVILGLILFCIIGAALLRIKVLRVSEHITFSRRAV